MSTPIRLFTQPAVLEQLGHRRLARFFQDFERDLIDAGNPLPFPHPEDASSFTRLAAAFGRTDLLPEKLRAALPLIEAAAFSENATLLDSVIQRRIPCISLNRSCPLDCALELWFACPEELPQFVKARSDTPTLRPTDSAPASPFTAERSEVPIPNRGSSSSVTPPKSDEGD